MYLYVVFKTGINLGAHQLFSFTFFGLITALLVRERSEGAFKTVTNFLHSFSGVIPETGNAVLNTAKDAIQKLMKTQSLIVDSVSYMSGQSSKLPF